MKKNEEFNKDPFYITMRGTKKIQKPIPLTFCDMEDCVPNTPAFWRCDFKKNDPDMPEKFEGCYKFMCNEHCRKYTPLYPKGYMGQLQDLTGHVKDNMVHSYCCSNPVCQTNMEILMKDEFSTDRWCLYCMTFLIAVLLIFLLVY
jgi:hypothetical protein